MGLLRNLFAPQQPMTPVQQNENDLNRQHGETYTAYGTRICAKVNGSEVALEPCLQRIYLTEKNLQSQDQQLQDRRKGQLKQEITEIDGKIARLNIEEDRIAQRISDNQTELTTLQSKLAYVKNQNGDANKMAKVKMTIGLVILLILSVYLFIFYSSTFYSAFFKQFTFDTGVAEAMFDQQAIPNAFHKGLGCLMFILCAPVIFMGLGYVLHYYASEKGKMKYPKIIAILIITFIFDCILAYLIAKNIYNMEILTKLGEFPEFSLSIAITDVNVWAVIFCGFITYMIWGFVFDLTISAYEEMKSNRKEIAEIESQIKANKELKADLNDNGNNIRIKIADLESKKQAKQLELSTTVFFYDETIIKTAMINFFTGWVTIMQPMGHTPEHQQRARDIFNRTIDSLFN